ncbi:MULTISPECIES: SDR family NAD(P)-dependent oxidoreductase [unclassified Paenibacillus]|uniref:SDR family NAD(P)-dependent oxidoreductase n=1 Tax=unclassified Paenibacillus TaxID=185978 RepID=UPI00277D34A6|nr:MULTISPECIES: SDR family NAD(P)-dependent oxidoreductase [unclassified Paenibacillus]MDQ0901552.1 UDP-N-acetylglucosamine 4,6-dehydratase [Paenibacillus sp. V4I7]MDQ0919945.1 UDP-N-acetylglucosamine 4,6-dehydratase [Paenibacillus sp. V4I5]
MFENRVILITGGTGSWGHELVKQLLRQAPKQIIIYSRNEMKQVAMKQQFQDSRLSFQIGDIRDKEALVEACKGVHYLFHLAALKHVPICENQPHEALKTNVDGTQNVIEAAIHNQVQTVVYVSTDKAANPYNFYGLTKAIGEKLIISANLEKTNTKFVCVRGGNVLGSNGSVVHIFQKQIRDQLPIGITHKGMTRFFLTLQDSVGLLFQAVASSKGGEIFVLKMPACRILDLAEAIADIEGKTENMQIVEQGIRPGEKIHEILFSEHESSSTVHYNSQYFVILPPTTNSGANNQYSHCQPVSINQYCSRDDLMSVEEIKQLLLKGKILYE